jgi:hypothetical protein
MPGLQAVKKPLNNAKKMDNNAKKMDNNEEVTVKKRKKNVNNSFLCKSQKVSNNNFPCKSRRWKSMRQVLCTFVFFIVAGGASRDASQQGVCGHGARVRLCPPWR